MAPGRRAGVQGWGLGVGWAAEQPASDNGEVPGRHGGPGTICPGQAKRVLLLAGDRADAQTRCAAWVGTYAAVVGARRPVLGSFCGGAARAALRNFIISWGSVGPSLGLLPERIFGEQPGFGRADSESTKARHEHATCNFGVRKMSFKTRT